MTRPLDRHLDSDELDAIVASEALGVFAAERLLDEAVRDAQRHVEACQDCDRKVRMHRSAQKTISLWARNGQSAETADCLDETEWARVAAGVLEETEAQEHMRHAAQCGHCGPLLKAAVQILSNETSPAEEAVLTNLDSIRPEWQMRMARTLSGAGEPSRLKETAPSFWKSFFGRPRAAFATVGLAILIAAVWIGIYMLRSTSAEQLLAQAYTERRTVEVRIPGAKYAPMRVERGGLNSNFEKPQSLLKAEVLISERLGKQPNDPTWLDAKARAEILDGSYGDAINTLQRALELQPNSSELFTDLGSAYFLRAASSDRPSDYGNAMDSLGKALTQTPDNPVALYNRALVCEKIFLYSQAIDAWEHYLKVDPTGAWSEEVRERLRVMKEKVRTHTEAQSRPLWELSAFRVRSAEEIRNEISGRGDEYLLEATKHWLVDLSSRPPADKNEGIGASLGILAHGLSALHSDDWLAEMVTSNESPQMATASSFLSQAIEADASGNYDDAQSLARNAISEFQRAGSIPGVLRSRVELVYALDRSSQGRACLQEAKPLKRELRTRRYAWISIQVATEDAICQLITASTSDPMPEARDAMTQAKLSGYNNPYLRAWSNAISIASIRGDEEGAWREGALALQFYWDKPYPSIRLFQLCSELAFAAEDAGLLHASLGLSQEALSALSATHNLPVEATEHYRVASLARSVGLPQEAEQQFKEADLLFASVPKSNTTRGFQVDAETWLASMELDRGNIESANKLLDQAHPDLNLVPSLTVPLRFYKTKGLISLRRGDFLEADHALNIAIQIAQAGARAMRATRERVLWDNEVRVAYRTLAEIRFKQFADPHGALEVWEDYRALPLQIIGWKDQESAKEFNFETLEASSSSPQLGAVDRIAPLLSRSTSLSYEVTSSGVLIWTLDDRGLSSAWSPIPQPDLQNLLRNFNSQCATPDSDLKLIDSNARRLYDLLIRPIKGSLDSGRTLMVDLDEVLSGLPFELLTDESGTMVGDKFLAVQLPGIELLQKMRDDRPLAITSSALIVGPPVVNVSLPSIPDANSEAAELASILPNSHLLTGANATLYAVQSQLSDGEIFHFSGHALSAEDRSGLLLAADSTSSSREGEIALLNTSKLDLTKTKDLQLVVLAACSTGPKAHGTNLSPDNLVVPFMASGVPHVVATLWDVDSAATAKLTHAFYQYLLSGISVSASLQRAKADLRRDSRFKHPYYWAAFTAFGRL